MAYENTEAAKEAVYNAIGIVDNRIDGVWVSVDVTEMYTSGWRAKATGRFQFRMSSPYNGRGGRNRDTILRTRKELNNEFDLEAVKAAVVEYVTVKKRLAAEDKARMEKATSNKSIVERIIGMYKGRRFVSNYSSSDCAVFASEFEEGKVRMKWDFGTVDADTAEKIMNFINEVGA
jgi:hypothetical protein